MNEISMHGFTLDQADTEGCIFDAEDTGNELGVSWTQKTPALCQCLDKSYLDADLRENQGGIIWKDHQPTGTGSQDWGHLSPAEESSGYRRSYQWGLGVYFMLAFININLSVGQDTELRQLKVSWHGGPPASCRSRPSDLSHWHIHTECAICPLESSRCCRQSAMATRPPKRHFLYPSTTCIFNLKILPITLESS